MKKYFWLTFFITLVLPILIFFPFSIHIHEGLPNAIDPLFYTWNLGYNAWAFHQGISALFDTNIFYPLTNTIAFSDTLWSQSLFTSPIIWITGNPILAQNILIMLTFPLSAISMFLLTRYLTRNDKAAVVAGLFYAFSYPRIAQIGHLPMLSSQWLPVYFLSLFKFLEEGKPKHMWMMFLWFLLSITSSIYFGVFLTVITIVVIFVDLFYRIQAKQQLLWKKYMPNLLISLVPMTFMLLFVLFPYIRLKIENPDIKRSIDDVTFLRASLVDYLQVGPTSVLSRIGFPVGTTEHTLYPLISVVIAALFGVIAVAKKNKHMFMIVLSVIVVSFVLSLGNEQSFSIGPFHTGTLKLPYYYLYYAFVPLQIIRAPARFAIIISLFLSLLGAYGVTHLIQHHKSKVIGIILVLFFIEIWQIQTPWVTIPSLTQAPAVYTYIQKLPKQTVIAEVPLEVFYSGNSMEKQLLTTYPNLRQKDTYTQETHRIYFSLFHKKRMINGYSGFFPATYNAFAEKLDNFPSDVSIHMLRDNGVTHIVVHLKQYSDEKQKILLATLPSYSSLELVYNDGTDWVYQIKPK